MVIQLNEEEKADVLRMRAEGCTMKEIAEYIGCSVAAVNYQLKKAGVRYCRRWNDEHDKALVELYNSGVGSGEIAKLLKRSATNVRHRISYLRKIGANIIYHKK